MDHHVRAELDGPKQIRSGEGIVHNQGNAVPVGDVRHRFHVNEIDAGIPDGLHIQGLGPFGNSGFKVARIVGIYKGGANA